MWVEVKEARRLTGHFAFGDAYVAQQISWKLAQFGENRLPRALLLAAGDQYTYPIGDFAGESPRGGQGSEVSTHLDADYIVTGSIQ